MSCWARCYRILPRPSSSHVPQLRYEAVPTVHKQIDFDLTSWQHYVQELASYNRDVRDVSVVFPIFSLVRKNVLLKVGPHYGAVSDGS